MPTRRTSDIPMESAQRAEAPRAAARSASKPVAPPRVVLTAEARRALIAKSAYLRAERRGFTPGHETEDWLAAEAEVDGALKVELGGSSQ
jgi:DUF2934 family protein